MAEDSITPPAKGDPITAAWAQAVTAAVNGAQGADESPDSLRTPDGLVSPPPCDEMMEAPGGLPMPFDVRMDRDALNADHYYRVKIYLPAALNENQVSPPDSYLARVWRELVYVDSWPVAPDALQTVGTVDDGWVSLGDIAAHGGTTEWRVFLTVLSSGVSAPGNTENYFARSFSWLVWVGKKNAGGGYGPVSNANAIKQGMREFATVCIASLRFPSSVSTASLADSAETGVYGVQQMRRGTIVLTNPPWIDADFGTCRDGTASGVQHGVSLDRAAAVADGYFTIPETAIELRGFRDDTDFNATPDSHDIIIRDGSVSGAPFLRYVRDGFTGTRTVIIPPFSTIGSTVSASTSVETWKNGRLISVAAGSPVTVCTLPNQT